MMDDPALQHLTATGTAWAVVGAHAPAAHGVARFTVDVDVLVMSTTVLDHDFWPASIRSRIAAMVTTRCRDWFAWVARWRSTSSSAVVL